MPRVYCVAYGCLNSAVSRPQLSFFKLPTEVERRAKWLHLINREDLMDRPPQNYTVCEEHFDSAAVLTGTHRKKLKNNAIPTLCLPDIQHKPALPARDPNLIIKKTVHTSTDAVPLVDGSTQTDQIVTFLSDRSTQTLSSDSLKRKLETDSSEEYTEARIKLEVVE